MRTIPARRIDDRIELVTDDEVILTPAAATVLVRIVRQHLDSKDATVTPSARRHIGAAH